MLTLAIEDIVLWFFTFCNSLAARQPSAMPAR
jgi:hypothetical protein